MRLHLFLCDSKKPHYSSYSRFGGDTQRWRVYDGGVNGVGSDSKHWKGSSALWTGSWLGFVYWIGPIVL